jgi:hypothetical protein
MMPENLPRCRLEILTTHSKEAATLIPVVVNELTTLRE